MMYKFIAIIIDIDGKSKGTSVVLRTVWGRCWSPFSKAISPLLSLVINPAVGCRYFLPSLRLPSQLYSVTAVGQYQFILLDELRVDMWQRNGQGLNPWAVDN